VAAALAVLAVVGLLVFSALGFWELLRTAFQSTTGAWSFHPLQHALTQRYMILGPLRNSLLLAVPVALAATVLVSLLDSWGQAYGPSHWTGLRYTELLRSEELRRAVRNTLSLALGSAVVIAYTAQRCRQRLVGRLALLADRVSFVAFAVPGLVIGLALILAFSGGWLQLYGTQWILLVAYTLRFSGVGVRSVAARLSQTGIELEAAGQVAGRLLLRLT